MLDASYIRRQTVFSRGFPFCAAESAYLVLRHINEKIDDKSKFYFFSNHGACTNIDILPARASSTGRKDCLRRIGEDLFKNAESLAQAYLQCSGALSPTLSVAYANNFLSNGSQYGWLQFINNYLKQWNQVAPIEIKESINCNFLRKISFGLNSINVDEYPEKVSVIVPVFNAEETLRYSVESLLNQNHKNIEIILVDDCSLDNSYEIAKELSSSDGRVIALQNKKNLGAYFSRNYGLSVATGDLITVHDADDLSFPDRIAYQVSVIREKNAVAHLGGYFRMNAEGYLTGYRVPGKFSYDGFTHQCLVSLMIKADFLRKHLGCWDSVRFGADAELFHRLKKIAPLGVVEDWRPLIIALDSPQSLTGNSETKLGSPARNEYAQNFLAWHAEAKIEDLRLEPGSLKRAFPVPSICLSAS
ncbi:glycosyltransferase family A protein [Pantoea sp. 18069]|uniref:glycosyltransferase family 2 protein n=1 Tax=Pantoea sp. 18069 TaxID=2681415 RepID=UPI001356EDA8|nr:glycosyltransferase family A protein [Pantoea sp. 18069]